MKLRPLDQEVTNEDVNLLNNTLSGRNIWDALGRQAPVHLSWSTRIRIMNDLINELSSEQVTPVDLYNNFEKYKGRRVCYTGKTGVLSDVAFVGQTDTYHMVIDGTIWGASRDAELRVEVVKPAERQSIPAGQVVRITAANLWTNKNEWKGQHVAVERVPELSGIFTDAGSNVSVDRVSLVLDGSIVTMLQRDCVLITNASDHKD